MMIRPLIFLSGATAFSLLLSANMPTAVYAKPEPKEWVKYFSPMPEKNYSLNKNQDRVIKKKGFKRIEITGAKPLSNKELGFFAIVPLEQLSDTTLINRLLDKPEVNGLSVLLPWHDLEPKEDQFDWTKLDNLLSLVKAKGKTLILRISTCGADKEATSDTPDWVFEAGAKSLTYKDESGKEHKMPIFWDTTYLPRWNNFIQALGKKYDKNPALHSVGITGGGARGSMQIVPVFGSPLNKERYEEIEKPLVAQHGMTQRQLVEHWKYVGDIFPKAFPNGRLNLDIDPPTPNRPGQDSLDEISDYLVYRYGERIYLTRQNVSDAKHGFDQYRVLLKFRPDTLTGYQVTPDITVAELSKLEKNALDDGVSFVELPANLLDSQDEAVVKALADLRSHIGYQLVSQKVQIPGDVKAGDVLKINFAFTNLGNASAMHPVRNLDKDDAGSYKVQIELRDNNDKPVAILLHTPAVPTNKWLSGKPITWEGDLKTPAKLKPGEYNVYLSLIEPETKRKLEILNALTADAPKAETSLSVGKLKVIQ
ncbi:MAG: DUF4832 domain-containing protein [Cyanobacteria bacterium SZAS LIN-3]|nr:DUF4832 domain-containing protein [Cyanobacteria bacterium SZAS LIN-3]